MSIEKEIHIERNFFFFLCFNFVLWVTAPLAFRSAPPLDVVEWMNVGLDWQLVTYKHPNLPGILLQIGTIFSGKSAVSAYILSQMCIAATLLGVYKIARIGASVETAIVASASLIFVYYFTWPTPELNHNVLQMPIWVWFIYCFWWATQKPDNSRYWVLVGVCAGLGLWTKLSFGVLLLSSFIWISSGERRELLFKFGPWLSLIILSLFVAILAWQLDKASWAPIEYAKLRTLVGGGSVLSFMGAYLAYMTLPIIFLVLFKAIGMKKNRITGEYGSFVTAHLFLPLAVLVFIALTQKGGIRDAWAAPMFSLATIWVLAAFGKKIDRHKTTKFLVATSIFTTSIAAAYAADLVFRDTISPKPKRGNWPILHMAKYFEEEFFKETATDLRYVVGDMYQSGVIALGSKNKIDIVVDGDFLKSTTISYSDLNEKGFIALWRMGTTLKPTMRNLFEKFRFEKSMIREVRFDWSKNNGTDKVAMNFVIFRPKNEK